MNVNLSNDPAKRIGNRIRAERLRRHLTQEEFGRLLGISPSYLGALERGSRPVSRKIMGLLHERLDLSYDYLMEGKNTYPEAFQSHTLREPGGYHLRRDLSLMLSSCSPEEAKECYDLVHTYLSYARSSARPESPSIQSETGT
ncbi:MAG: helix-turn-helix transcriptional regulator [Lachnospiraceae bacterium]|nr:helix-turn-helix transcriptional regulator [Lachnospiraceae bacterium]